MQIGLLGGGQLGRMMIQAAHRMGHTVVVLDPDPLGPAGQLADDHVVGDYRDAQALAVFASKARVFTTEFENVPAESLRFLSAHGATYPSADCVERAQDRLVEKAFIASAGVPVRRSVARCSATASPISGFMRSARSTASRQAAATRCSRARWRKPAAASRCC